MMPDIRIGDEERSRRRMRVLADIHNLNDMREAARRRLPKGIFEFIDRGAEDEIAISNNRRAIDDLKFSPKVPRDVSGRTADTVLFGKRHGMPAAIAPTGAAGLVRYQGELELARAAAQANIPFTLATRSTISLEEVAARAGGTLWFQLYVWADRSLSHGIVERAAKAGYEALVVTVDTPAPPNREYNHRNGFSLPFVPSGRAVLDMARHPKWLFGVMGRYLLTTGMPRYENQPGEHNQKMTRGAETLASRISDSVTWEDIATLRRLWPRTLILKGILRADDARKAVEHGVDGVVVSNHGGRCLDAAVAPLDALPGIADAVAGRATILVDGGFRRGSDIAKAICLGASAVLLGRTTLFGTAVAGEKGAHHALAILRRELLTVMAMTGASALSDLEPDLLVGGSRT